MSELWTPPKADVGKRPRSVTAEHAAVVREWEASVLSMMYQEGGILDHWNAELKKIDKNLRLMQAMPMAVAPGVKPGYYHLVRLRDDAENTIMWVQPLHDLSGNYAEPTGQMLQALKWADLQSDQVVRARQENDARDAASRARTEERDREERVDHGVEVFKSLTRTQVSTNTDTPWTQNNSAAAKRARGEKTKGKKRA